jgi:hypothetical protein
MKAITALLLLMALSAPVAASDTKKGMFVGGGVGAEVCPVFLNAMATARQRGGASTSAGLLVVTGYVHYVLGFQTGFNSEAEGIYDIFASLGPDAAFNVLYAVEPWCAKHPAEKFGNALLVLAYQLREKAKGN